MNIMASGELMPFNPLHACAQLEPSLFTQNFTRKDCAFAPLIRHNKVIVLVQQPGPCSLESKIRQVSRTDNVAGMVIIHKDDNLPNDMDLDLLGSRIPVVMLRHATGSALLALTHWYREAAIKKSALFATNSSQYNPHLSLPDLSDDNSQVVFHNLTDNEPYASSSESPTGLLHASPDDGEPKMEDIMWIKATLLFDDHVDGLGIVEFSLIVVVVLLGAAFVTSVCLHCYFYRFRRNHPLTSQGTAASVAFDPTHHPDALIPLEALPFMPLCTFSEYCGMHLQSHQTQKDALLYTDLPQEESNVIEIDLDKYVPVWKEHYGPALTTLNDTCPVCLDEFDEHEKLRELPCFHLYHPECIDEWLTKKIANCPLCKFDVYTAMLKRLKEGPPHPEPSSHSPESWLKN
jgi:Ring finger domain